MNQRIHLLIICCFIIYISSAPLPVAILHGIGDSCSNSGMSDFTDYFSQNLGGVYTVCIESGGGAQDFFTSFKYQSEKACEKIKSDPNFQWDFSVVGLSQGALIARYIIEKCEMKGSVKRYISIGGPQMGVGSMPQCTSGIICKAINRLIGMAVYSSYIQGLVGPAGYYKDITNYSTYLQYSSFLSDLNNEKDNKTSRHKDRFMALQKVVLIKFSEDTMIIPRETAWFQFYDNDKNVVDLKNSDFYKNDYIGLKTLDDQNKINFVEIQGNHLDFSDNDILRYMIPDLK